jgi:hypothetical protein
MAVLFLGLILHFGLLMTFSAEFEMEALSHEAGDESGMLRDYGITLDDTLRKRSLGDQSDAID